MIAIENIFSKNIEKKIKLWEQKFISYNRLNTYLFKKLHFFIDMTEKLYLIRLIDLIRLDDFIIRQKFDQDNLYNELLFSHCKDFIWLKESRKVCLYLH